MSNNKQPISIAQNRDCMELMREAPDKFWDLAVVDPPYGIGEDGGKVSRHHSQKKYKKKGWDNATPDGNYFKELFRVSKNQIIWGGNYFIDHLKPGPCWICWDKDRYGDFADGELAWGSFGSALRIFKFTWDGFRKQEPADRFHPTQKPIALYKWILKNYAKPGDKILDTHLGSGSSRIAAWDMGFDFWASELDADYFEAQEKRFEAHRAKPTLFAPEQMYNFEQAKLFSE